MTFESVPSSDFAQGLYYRRALGFSGLTLLTWDFFLTVDDEVEYIWRAPWTVAKAAFLFVRYGNMFSQALINTQQAGFIIGPSPTDFCTRFTFFVGIFSLISAESIHILVLVRACALWGCRVKVTLSLIAVYMVYLSLSFVFLAFTTITVNNGGFPYVNITGTCVANLPPYAWLFWVISIAIDVCVFTITMRCLRSYSKAQQYLSPLVTFLYRDAFTFFIVSTLSSIFTIVLWLTESKNPVYFAAITFSLPIVNIAGLRLVLNLRSLNPTGLLFTTGQISQHVERQLVAFRSDGDRRAATYANGLAVNDPADTGQARIELDDIELANILAGDASERRAAQGHASQDVSRLCYTSPSSFMPRQRTARGC